MLVKIYDLENSKMTFRSECELRECFPDDFDAYEAAYSALSSGERWVVGGGAAPLVVLEPA